MKTTLYNIKNDYLNLINEIESLEGEITPEMETQLQINESQLQGKSIAYLEVIRESEHYGNKLDEEIKRLQKLKKKSDKLGDYLKTRLLDAVRTFGDFEVDFNKFGTRKSESVEVENINILPDKYKTIKVVETADKTAIKKALKEGLEIEGAKMITNINLKIN